MSSRLRSWWKDGQDGAVAVYPARLMLPLILLTAIVLVLYVTLPDSRASSWLLPAYWVACAIPLLVRRRRAGRSLRLTRFFTDPSLDNCRGFHLQESDVRISYFQGLGTGYNGPTLRLEFIVGGQIDVLLRVSKTEEIIRRLEQCT